LCRFKRGLPIISQQFRLVNPFFEIFFTFFKMFFPALKLQKIAPFCLTRAPFGYIIKMKY